MKKILFASNNKGKIKEFKNILKCLNCEFIFLTDLDNSLPEPEESGQTLAENAAFKAEYYGKKFNLLTLADDSGLFVAQLKNQLGVKTKRWRQGSDKIRCLKLLKAMEKMTGKQRTAKFICAVAFYNPKNGKLKLSWGVCRGKIAFKAKGSHGFGFDPVFIPEKKEKCFAELKLKEKSMISHRSRALKKIMKTLKKYEN